MLLLHQLGNVKVGGVVRYTFSYTPCLDEIVPTPAHLFVKIRNTAAIPLRAAYLHGPYSLYTSVYPANFSSTSGLSNSLNASVPKFEPYLKAGASWTTRISVPSKLCVSQDNTSTAEEVRNNISTLHRNVLSRESVSWIIEVSSQILFSASASVGFEVLVSRSENIWSVNEVKGVATGTARPGQLDDFLPYKISRKARIRENQKTSRRLASNSPPCDNTGNESKGGEGMGPPDGRRGIFSRSVKLKVHDTHTLWNLPALPTWDGNLERINSGQSIGLGVHPLISRPAETLGIKKPSCRKRIHLVILTHGLLGNVGADMLFLKESIDRAAQRVRRARTHHFNSRCGEKNRDRLSDICTEDLTSKQSTKSGSGGDDEVCDMVIVRGFHGNAARTEKGIEYLGKRLAKYVLELTYPDQPYSVSRASRSKKKRLASQSQGSTDSELCELMESLDISESVEKRGGAVKSLGKDEMIKRRAYQYVHISFIGHSLGGLVQTYALGYIQKHSPQFFTLIRPQHFITLASPMLGLSNENPVYVRFALDVGLAGRTGQDLGFMKLGVPLSRAAGWTSVIHALPRGPAYEALRCFRHRTLYSNVVNDGIVPLRTSCLFFLDWNSLGRVEKTRRDCSLIGKMAEWGWAEITGQNTLTMRVNSDAEYSDNEGMKDKQPALDDEVIVDDSSENKSTDSMSPGGVTCKIERKRKGGSPAVESSVGETGGRKGLNSTQWWWNNLMNVIFFTRSVSKAVEASNTCSKIDNGDGNESVRKVFDGSSPTSTNSGTVRSTRRDKSLRIVTRSQTLNSSSATDSATTAASEKVGSGEVNSETGTKSGGDSGDCDTDIKEFKTPPTTSIFESAGDLLNPPIPSISWIMNPAKRVSPIFHDRIYYPRDIPPIRQNKRVSSFNKTTGRVITNRLESWNKSSKNRGVKDKKRIKDGSTQKILSEEKSHTSVTKLGEMGSSEICLGGGLSEEAENESNEIGLTEDDEKLGGEGSYISMEERIARDYHRELEWRKVLVNLEPDAHNNICVRRMFPNAYGWPVVEHLCRMMFDTRENDDTDDYSND